MRSRYSRQGSAAACGGPGWRSDRGRVRRWGVTRGWSVSIRDGATPTTRGRPGRVRKWRAVVAGWGDVRSVAPGVAMRVLPVRADAPRADLKRVADQSLPVAGPPPGLQGPPESDGPGPPSPRRISPWA